MRKKVFLHCHIISFTVFLTEGKSLSQSFSPKGRFSGSQQTISLALENEASKVGARAWTGSWRLKYLVLRGISRTKKVQERAMSVKEVTGEDGAKIRQL